MTPELEKKIEQAAKLYCQDLYHGEFLTMVIKEVFILGAKSPEAKEYWQKGMYTEEEVKKLIALKYMRDYNDEYPEYLSMTIEESLNEIGDWFEQNKKK